MKNCIQLLCLFIISISVISCNTNNEKSRVKEVFLDGTQIINGESKNGTLPFLQIQYPESHLSKGTVLFLKNEDKVSAEDDSIITMFRHKGFAVVAFKGKSENNLSDAVKAFRLIRTSQELNLKTDYTCILAASENAKFAALTMNELSQDEQPNALILINPLGFEETNPGTVFPKINPPYSTHTKLLCFTDTLLMDETAMYSSNEYVKTWIGYDGDAFFRKKSNNEALAETIAAFLNGELVFKHPDENPAALPVEGYASQRHAEKIKLLASNKYDLICVGNSITNNFENPQFQPVWEKYFASRNALNLGYSGYRTENIIWNLQNGELQGQSPKVIILGIGTNNIDEKNYPTRHTAGQLAGGIEKTISIIREKCPDSKVILLRCFPGCYGGPNPTSHRRILERASDITSHIADGKHIFYCDINHVFLNMDGSINHEMMDDWLHPTPAGAMAWAQAMEPLLSQLMGDKSRDDEIPSNTAIVPVPKLEEDSYNWWGRHTDVLKIKDSLNPEIVLIGNSITHFWGGKYPPFISTDGSAREPSGPNAWNETFGKHRVLNLGFGWDRTQNVLWRLDHGEFDDLNPKLVLIHIGSNNTSETENARKNTADEIVDGIEAICMRVRSKAPGTKIILMAIMPRENKPDHPRRQLINEINKKLKIFAGKNEIILLDIGTKMLTPEGILTREIAPDFCHPNNDGYKIWGEELKPFIQGIESKD